MLNFMCLESIHITLYAFLTVIILVFVVMSARNTCRSLPCLVHPAISLVWKEASHQHSRTICPSISFCYSNSIVCLYMTVVYQVWRTKVKSHATLHCSLITNFNSSCIPTHTGATCYLNALLQCLYLTPELREGLFSIDPSDLGVQEEREGEGQREGEGSSGSTTIRNQPPPPPPQEKLDDPHEEPDEGVVAQLLAMGFLHPCAHRCVLATQPTSSGANHFSAALEYALEHSEDPGINDPLPLPPTHDTETEPETAMKSKKKKRKKPRLIPLELQRLFSQLQGLNRSAVSTHELTERGFQWTGMDGSVQHDAHELNRCASCVCLCECE